MTNEQLKKMKTKHSQLQAALQDTQHDLKTKTSEKQQLTMTNEKLEKDLLASKSLQSMTSEQVKDMESTYSQLKKA